MDGWTNLQVQLHGPLFGLRREVLTLSATWVNPEDTTVRKCRSQETNSLMTHSLTGHLEQSHALRQTVEGCWLRWALGLGARGSGLPGVEFPFSKMEKALETGYTTRVLTTTELYTQILRR